MIDQILDDVAYSFAESLHKAEPAVIGFAWAISFMEMGYINGSERRDYFEGQITLRLAQDVASDDIKVLLRDHGIVSRRITTATFETMPAISDRIWAKWNDVSTKLGPVDEHYVHAVRGYFNASQFPDLATEVRQLTDLADRKNSWNILQGSDIRTGVSIVHKVKWTEPNVVYEDGLILELVENA